MSSESQIAGVVVPQLNGIADKTVNRLDTETPGPDIPNVIPDSIPTPDTGDAAEEGLSIAAQLAELAELVQGHDGVLTELTSKLTAAPADVAESIIDNATDTVTDTAEKVEVPWTHRGFGRRL